MKATALPSDQLNQTEILHANVGQERNRKRAVELNRNCTTQNRKTRLFKRSRSRLFNSSRVINLALFFCAKNKKLLYNMFFQKSFLYLPN
jgi:hypothetical protein